MTAPAPRRLPAALGAEERAELERLESAYEGAAGHPALGDAVHRSLSHPSPGAASFVTSAAPTASGRWAGFVHVAPGENDGTGAWEAGIVVARDAPDRAATTAALLEAAAAHAAANRAPGMVVWIPGAGADERAGATGAGFSEQRALMQLRVPIPPAEAPAWPAGTTVRAFRPGADDDAWLAVNNRAFSDHPDQGAWTRATLEGRRREPWFDPDGFLLAEDADGLAGFCWTKVHPPTAHDPALGEIYVIGVEPSRQGRGLGRALVLAGLHSLAGRGPRVGMLYVDSANRAATGLYRALGFREHRTDRAFATTTAPAGAGRGHDGDDDHDGGR